MFKVISIKTGEQIKSLIKKNLYLRYKLFNYEQQKLLINLSK